MLRLFFLAVLTLNSLQVFADRAVMSDISVSHEERTPRRNPPKKKFNCDNRVLRRGVASVYGLNNGSGDRSNQPLAGGGRLNVHALTAAMLSVPLHTWVEVTHARSGKKVMVYINDRGPYAPVVRGRLRPHPTRVIDLTPAAAKAIGIPYRGQGGLGPVSVRRCKKVA